MGRIDDRKPDRRPLLHFIGRGVHHRQSEQYSKCSEGHRPRDALESGFVHDASLRLLALNRGQRWRQSAPIPVLLSSPPGSWTALLRIRRRGPLARLPDATEPHLAVFPVP